MSIFQNSVSETIVKSMYRTSPYIFNTATKKFKTMSVYYQTFSEQATCSNHCIYVCAIICTITNMLGTIRLLTHDYIILYYIRYVYTICLLSHDHFNFLWWIVVVYIYILLFIYRLLALWWSLDDHLDLGGLSSFFGWIFFIKKQPTTRGRISCVSWTIFLYRLLQYSERR